MFLTVNLILLMSSKICNNTSNIGLNHYFSKKNTVDFSQRKKLKVRQKNMLLDNDVVKNNADVIILIMRLISRVLLQSRDMFY